MIVWKLENFIKDIQYLNPEWTYGMGNNKKSNELVILSKDF